MNSPRTTLYRDKQNAKLMGVCSGIADKSDKPSLADEIAALEGADAIDDELEQMKKALGKNGASKED